MTIKDIARLSGFGVSTVSRALNGHPDISEETREKINRIVAEYNFVPNRNARQLKQTDSRIVLILVKGRLSLFFLPILEQMQQQLSREKRSVVVQYVPNEENEVQYAQRLATELKPGGILFLSGNYPHFQKSFGQITLPCVICGANAESLHFANLGSVSVDDYAAGCQAVEYLLAHGHREIGLICGKGSHTAQLRRQGAVDALSRWGIEVDETNCAVASYSVEEGYAAAKILLERQKPLTAIFAMSDNLAFGAMRAVADRGKQVPGDVSVVGFDGMELAFYSIPRLTTLKQPGREMASAAVSLLLDMIQQKAQAAHIHLEAKLVEGESVSTPAHYL